MVLAILNRTHLSCNRIKTRGLKVRKNHIFLLLLKMKKNFRKDIWIIQYYFCKVQI